MSERLPQISTGIGLDNLVDVHPNAQGYVDRALMISTAVTQLISVSELVVPTHDLTTVLTISPINKLLGTAVIAVKKGEEDIRDAFVISVNPYNSQLIVIGGQTAEAILFDEQTDEWQESVRQALDQARLVPAEYLSKAYFSARTGNSNHVPAIQGHRICIMLA